MTGTPASRPASISEALSPTRAHSAGVDVEDAHGGPDQAGAGLHQRARCCLASPAQRAQGLPVRWLLSNTRGRSGSRLRLAPIPQPETLGISSRSPQPWQMRMYGPHSCCGRVVMRRDLSAPVWSPGGCHRRGLHRLRRRSRHRGVATDPCPRSHAAGVGRPHGGLARPAGCSTGRSPLAAAGHDSFSTTMPGG
jgi:hypothetical protein